MISSNSRMYILPGYTRALPVGRKSRNVVRRAPNLDSPLPDHLRQERRPDEEKVTGRSGRRGPTWSSAAPGVGQA